ncbi:Fibropellin-1 [Amphibalanus amphitrite]|uniref:Fibropellin-1 n=1 Tax=Amphibalanus amphitrite TaxID=1232801 RepID=A0A6A4VCB8_AMPAM|nr:Fibropellin-1 [Amphibalanus amphitrite]
MSVAPCMRMELMGCSRSECTDIDECATNNGGCHQKCVNSAGSFSCQCEEGYELFTKNGTAGFSVAPSETGLRDGDTYRINKTCVPKQCPGIEDPVNGLLVSTQDQYHYRDVISFYCNFGYVLQGASSLQCTSSGEWNGTVPTCECTPDYWISGTPPACPRIDCGVPPTTPGGSYGNYADTMYESSFFFGCEDTFSLAGQSSSNDNVVRCQADGTWDFGDLRCEGPVCVDPGRPADGAQIATSYEQGSKVSFTCNKPGYIPFSGEPIECVRQPECATIRPLGITDGRIPAASINASTQRANYESDKVRLSSVTGWCGQLDQPFTYVQVDLGTLHRVKAILLKGVVTNDVVGRPTEIRFFYKRSEDEDYVVYFPNFNLTARDPGNYGELAMITLPESVETRFVILGIISYDKNPCLKFELLGCEVEETQPLLGFDMGYSMCVDAEPPQFVNCPSELLQVTKGENGQILPVNFTEPIATDNSGMIVRTDVRPAGFSPPVYVFRDLMLEYLAFDFDGNVAICQMNITVPDDTPPRITCPQSYVVELVEEQELYEINFNRSRSQVTVSDDTDDADSIQVVFEPSAARIPIGGYENVTVTAKDASGNSAQCHFQVAVQATPCVAWDLKAPANGDVNCLPSESGGLRCLATCKEGYRFTDGEDIKRFGCQPKQAWEPASVVPDCVTEDTQQASYDVSARISYRSNGAVAPECVNMYKEELKQFHADLSSVLSARCSQAVNLNMDVRLLDGGARRIAENMVELEHVLRITPEVSQPLLYDLCGLNLGLIFELAVPSTSVVIQPLIDVDAIGNQCPPMRALDSNVTRGFTCSTGEVLNSESSNTNVPRCLHCPAGTFAKTEDEECTVCPMGQYQDQSRQGACKSCPSGTYTRHEGSKSVKDCVPVCGYGTYSPSGLVPCLECPRNSFTMAPPADGFKECSSCPPDTFTHAQAANDQALCRAKCAPGSYSANGLEPCFSCPVNFFQPIEGANTCFECPTGNTTRSEGAVSPTDCVPVTCSEDTCEHGGLCQMLGHRPKCFCPAGFSGARCEIDVDECLSSPCYNGGSCIDQQQGYRCQCAAGYSGINCQIEETDCVEDTCPARAMCMDLPGVGQFECLCREGYTGPSCNVTVDPCTETGNPCEHGARCVPLQQGRYRCECGPGWSGARCEVNTDDCSEQPCLLGAECTDLVNDFQCACPTGFAGKRCERKIDLCAGSPCENGLCVDRFFTHQCVCDPGWTGASCDINVDDCRSEPCAAGSTCMDEVDGFSCNCAPGFTGKQCQHTIDDCASEPCQNGGTCKDEQDGFTCSCRPGFVGLQCEAEIDECTSSPCSPQGTERCVDLDNTFQCECRVGYSGRLCETNKDECASNPCLNEAGFFCACPSGTDGSRCEVTPERCVGSPCMNGGFCRDYGSGLNCSCPDDYLGVGCQHELDACEAGLCQNGATCVDNGLGYQCTCAPGYTGMNCETAIPRCTAGSCPTGATCVDLVDGHYCRCPFNLTGEDCRKSITVDYDLYFNDDSKSASASLYAPFDMQKASRMSIGLWVQFSARLDIGTFFTLYDVSSLHVPSDRRVIVQMRSHGVLLDLFEDEDAVFLDFNPQIPVNDRQWHHIVLSWESSGAVQLVSDLVVIGKRNDYGVNKTLPAFGYVTLGAPLAEDGTQMAKSGFKGKLARVNMWSRMLDIRTEIPKQLESCRKAPVLYDGLLLRWSGYHQLMGTVEREGPSSCGQLICAPGYTGDCTTRARDKTPPRVDFCPGDLWIQASNGSTIVRWDEPRFSDDDKLMSVVEINDHAPGQLFSWGSHDIVYIAKDDAENSALCSFRVHVLIRASEELAMARPGHSIDVPTAAAWGFNHGYLQILRSGAPLKERLKTLADREKLTTCERLMLLCPSDGRIPDDAERLDGGRLVSVGRAAPFSKSVAGARSREYGAHAVFKVTRHGSTEGEQRLVAAEAVASLRTMLTVAEAMKGVKRRPNQLETPQLVSRFVSVLRDTIARDQNLRAAFRLVEYDSRQEGALQKALEAAVFKDEAESEEPAIASESEPEHVPEDVGAYLAWSFLHGYLKLAVAQRNVASELEKLQKDSGLNLPLKRIVIICPTEPNDWTDDITELDEHLQPVKDVGGVKAAVPALSGRSYGNFSIYRCGSEVGASCFAVELATPLRTLRLGVAAANVDPSEYTRAAAQFTEELGNLLKEFPDVAAHYCLLKADRGERVHLQLNQLAGASRGAKEICPTPEDPKGGYQECSTWGPNGRFRYCQIRCDPGLQFSQPIPDFYVCGPEGFWRPNDQPNTPLIYPSCAPAEQAQRVVKIKMNFPSSVFCNNAGKNVLDKRIREALQKLNKNWNFCINTVEGDECDGLNVNVNCGQRARSKRQTENDGLYEVEISFPAQNGPVTNADTNQAADVQALIERIILENSQLPNVVPDPASLELGSEYYCEPGKVVFGDQCVSCAAGTFYERSTGTCVKCALGTYQDQLGQSSCIPCPAIAGRPGVTAIRGAQSVGECKERCSAGRYYDNELLRCHACGFGNYQPEEGQFSCSPCGPGLTTRTSESVTGEECKPECDDGEQLSLDNSCQPCARGTYRTRGEQPACVACPEGTTTLDLGSSTVEQCSLPICREGTFLNTTDGNRCMECPLGTYQPKSQQTACIECRPDTTTEQVGATSAEQCVNPCDGAGDQKKCDANAICLINTETNAFKCECKLGFEGNGFNCTDRCEGFCDNSGVCAKDERTGMPKCSCVGSFTGERCVEKSKFAYITAGVAGVVVLAIVCVLFVWMICVRANKKKQQEPVQKAMTIPPDAASQVNFYYGAPTPYAESIAPSHHSTYAHYYDEEDDAWEMPNFYNETYMRDGLHPGKANSLARSNASIYGAARQDELYDRLRKHAYTGKKDKNDTTDDSDDQAR